MTPTALLTGASSPVGQAIASALAEQGHLVFGVSRTAPASASPFAEVLQADLADPLEQCRVAQAAEGATVLVHAAGHRFAYHRFHAQPPEDAAQTWAVDYGAFAHVAQLLLPSMMRARTGRIIAITSLHARLGGPGCATYAAAKAACEGLVRSLACDYGRFGITANAVAPGPIEGPRLEARRADDAGRALAQRAALRRIPNPEDVASAVGYLCGPGGASVTGQVLTVSAGIDLLTQW